MLTLCPISATLEKFVVDRAGMKTKKLTFWLPKNENTGFSRFYHFWGISNLSYMYFH